MQGAASSLKITAATTDTLNPTSQPPQNLTMGYTDKLAGKKIVVIGGSSG